MMTKLCATVALLVLMSATWTPEVLFNPFPKCRWVWVCTQDGHCQWIEICDE